MKRVLVVEHDRDINGRLVRGLQAEGFRVSGPAPVRDIELLTTADALNPILAHLPVRRL